MVEEEEEREAEEEEESRTVAVVVVVVLDTPLSVDCLVVTLRFCTVVMAA